VSRACAKRQPFIYLENTPCKHDPISGSDESHRTKITQGVSLQGFAVRNQWLGEGFSPATDYEICMRSFSIRHTVAVS